MRGEIEQSLAQTYRRLTYASALVMAVGWIWHLIRGDRTNWLIDAGVGLLLLTPLLALAHLAWLAKERDSLAARYSWIALALLGMAVVLGLLIQRLR
ncbi:MAG: hypothetical protein N2651_10075 [Fimbriimonadales bacterium]|nr:hypothetical protein [Fimbriimonadales bacterium]